MIKFPIFDFMGKEAFISTIFAIVLILGVLYAIFLKSPKERFGHGGKLGNASCDNFEIEE